MAVVLLLAGAAMAEAGLSLPAGTGMRMKLETPISTDRSRVGDIFTARITEPVTVNGKTMVPVGASVSGRLTKLTQPRRIAGTPTISLMPDRITMPDGHQYLIAASVVDTAGSSHTTVDDEGKIHGRGRTGRDNAEMVAGAGAGAVIGTIAGGAKGLFIGGALGFGATAAHWLTKRHSAELPAGTEIVMEIDRPMTMTAGTAGE
jgi:hypothetical protein